MAAAAGMPGTGLTEVPRRQALSDRLALKPYWGKLNVRTFRGGDGDVGIIRSPVRAITLPDHPPPRVYAPRRPPREIVRYREPEDRETFDLLDPIDGYRYIPFPLRVRAEITPVFLAKF